MPRNKPPKLKQEQNSGEQETNKTTINDLIENSKDGEKHDSTVGKLLAQIILTQYQDKVDSNVHDWTLLYEICKLKNSDENACTDIKSHLECIEHKGLGECNSDFSN
jgi:hypothetical protein